MEVTLKKIELIDVDKIAKWKSDPVLAEQIMSSFEETDSETAKDWIVKNTNDKFQQLKGIYLEENGGSELLGITRLMYIDYESLNAEFGIYIGDNKHQNKGVGNKALSLTLESGFEQLNLTKIYLKVSANNLRAISLYKKKNFVIEGCLKQHYKKNGEFEDVLCMAIFKEDFR